MNDDDDCPGCGATSADRGRNKRDQPQGLAQCPHCSSYKCCMCDMGDDVECISCELPE